MTNDTHRFRSGSNLPRGGKTLIMGIVNMTPDSFSDGDGGGISPEQAVDRALALAAEGADIIDFGAESSRPGAVTLSAKDEIARIGDTIHRFRKQSRLPVSVDTYHPDTAARVLDQGADIINDITGLRGCWDAGTDSGMAALAARERAHLVIMHMPAAPDQMQNAPVYLDVVREVRRFLVGQAGLALDQGVPPERIWLDPGFGFGKTYQHNLMLLRHFNSLSASGYPILAGLSRKRIIFDALALPVDQRTEASLALAVMASMAGAAIVRVHDAAATARAVGMADAVRLGIL